MSRDFIFRSTNRKNSLDYLGYVLNVTSKDELYEAVLELGFNPRAMEYHAVDINSKAVAICMPFRGTPEQMKSTFFSINEIEDKYLGLKERGSHDIELKSKTDSGAFPADVFTGP